jgi:hypothetical protein
VTDDAQLAALADEIDALAERLADRSIELLRTALGGDTAGSAAGTERIVTRARRSLMKASTLLRGIPGDED